MGKYLDWAESYLQMKLSDSFKATGVGISEKQENLLKVISMYTKKKDDDVDQTTEDKDVGTAPV